MIQQFLIRVLGGSRATRPYSEIDPKIKPLVDTMNATGCIQTIASCQGHGSYGMQPYVYFKCPEQMASNIEKRLRSVIANSSRGCKFDWTIKGLFNQNFELCYLLYSPTYHEISESSFVAIHHFILRKALDDDLLALAREVKKAVFLDIRDNGKPTIAKKGD